MKHTTPLSPRIQRWPEGAIVYHIYPRSLQDSNGDGVGDLPGVVQRLDYIAQLGVQAIWLSPFYPSPMADFGYDVADYYNVHPLFGTLDDFKTLLKEAHTRHLKVIIDLVPNHTSDEHEWFKLSRLSKNSPYSRWYIWRDAHPNSPPGKPQPPNNWRDALDGSSAWEWDAGRQQFYLHSFNKHQPDLNWANPDVREAMHDIMRFWLDIGVDGFRVDAVYWMAKDPLFRDDAVNPAYNPAIDAHYYELQHNNSHGWPGVYSYLAAMAEILEDPAYQPNPRFMITEAYPPRHNPVANYLLFYTAMNPRVAAPFNFEGLELPWHAAPWRKFLHTFHSYLDEVSPFCVASYAFGNHDKSRLVSRLGEEAARSAALMEFTLPGMIFVYYGEELGMHDVAIPKSRIQDPAAYGGPHSHGRDPERTPMQWSAAAHAGFSTHEPWLPIAHDYHTRNVSAEQSDQHSFLNLYKQLAQLRTNSIVLRYGRLTVLDVGHRDILAYVRSKEGESQRYVTLINFSDKPVMLSAPVRQFVLSSHAATKLGDAAQGMVELLPHEGALFLE